MRNPGSGLVVVRVPVEADSTRRTEEVTDNEAGPVRMERRLQELPGSDSRLSKRKLVQVPGRDSEIWSYTDFPYQCLLDYKRTTAFQAAIQSIVKPGDIVVDAGAGSGILSF